MDNGRDLSLQEPAVDMKRPVRRPITEYPRLMEMMLKGWACQMARSRRAWAMRRMKQERGLEKRWHMWEHKCQRRVLERLRRHWGWYKKKVQRVGAQRVHSAIVESLQEQRMTRFQAELFPIWRT